MKKTMRNRHMIIFLYCSFLSFVVEAGNAQRMTAALISVGVKDADLTIIDSIIKKKSLVQELDSFLNRRGSYFLVCGLHAIKNAQILYDHLSGSISKRVADRRFVSEKYYRYFLRRHGLEQLHQKCRTKERYRPTNNDLMTVFSSVNKNIVVVPNSNKIDQYFVDTDYDYQVFIVKRDTHWIAFAVKKGTDGPKIFYVDSLPYLTSKGKAIGLKEFEIMKKIYKRYL